MKVKCCDLDGYTINEIKEDNSVRSVQSLTLEKIPHRKHG